MADFIGARPMGVAPYLSTTMVQPTGAGYDAPVAGLDEASARSALAAMQDQLARDPSAALGVRTHATVAELRAAFLQLTKQYHPVRFGRMALDIQKLSNEVFLALRAAHDALAKSLRQSVPIVPIAPVRGAMPSALGSQAMPPAPHPATAPPSGRATQPLSVKPARSSNDSGERPPVSPRTPTPATGVRVPTARPPASQPAARPAIPPIPPAPALRHAIPPTAPHSPSRQPVGPAPAAGPPPAPGLPGLKDDAAVIDLLQRQQWDQARSALHQLLAREPSSRRIRALMCYARGREAQLEGRVDDARVELQDALDLDPDLQLAKTALTALFTRRK